MVASMGDYGRGFPAMARLRDDRHDGSGGPGRRRVWRSATSGADTQFDLNHGRGREALQTFPP